jgi:hypothetical protein
MVFKDEVGYEIKHGGPQNGLEGCKHLGRNNSGNRVSGIMKTIDKIKNYCQADNNDQKGHISDFRVFRYANKTDKQ